MMYGDDWMWTGSSGWTGWILMTLVMVVFWAGLITAVVLAVRYVASGGSRGHSSGGGSAGAGNRAEDVLAERYAHGEIDDDEFQRRLTLLREHR